jgi:ribosomal protein S1
MKENLIGQTLFLKVIEVNQKRNRLILSERAAKQEARQQRLAELEEGQVLTGHIINLQSYGAFIDLSGVDGLLHISEIAHYRVKHPDEVFSLGDEVEVLVKSINIERERVSLSRKALLPSPWDTIEEIFLVDDLVSGKVSSVKDFGVFVEIDSGLVGLVHASQMSTYPDGLLQIGDEILARILIIDPLKERIALSIDDVSASEIAQWKEESSGTDSGEEVSTSAEGYTVEDAEARLQTEEEHNV